MTASLSDREPLGPFAEPLPDMHGKYLLRSKRSAQAIAIVDAGLALLPIAKPSVPRRLKRILLANWGHLGDLITTFKAIEVLRSRHPGVHIGMIASSWGQVAVKTAGLVDAVHVVDHWRINRAKLSLSDRRQRFRVTRAKALREIRAARYDAAIDFYPFFPPAHPLFFKAHIPIRVGFESGGFSPLLTHPVPWSNALRPIADQYRPLIDTLHPTAPRLPEGSLRPKGRTELLVPLPAALAGSNAFIVLHPGAGGLYKDWGSDRWKALVPHIRKSFPSHRIVVTGAGETELAIADELVRSFPDLINLAGRADWASFVSVIAHAALVICPDTAAGHVAALFDVPVVSIFTGTNIADQWKPYAEQVRVLLQPVVCAPCNRPGCEAMACIRYVCPEDVAQATRELLLPGDLMQR